MLLTVVPTLRLFKAVVQGVGAAIEFLRLVISVDIKHVLAFDKCLPAVARFRRLVSPVCIIEARALLGFILPILGLSLGSPFCVILRAVPLLLEVVPVRLLIFAILTLLAQPLLVLPLVVVFRGISGERVFTPLVVVILGAEPTCALVLSLELLATKGVILVVVCLALLLILLLL